MRILIIGGYGTFGMRLARLLADEADLTLLIAGRSLAKAEAFAGTLGGRAEAAVLDRDGELEERLSALKPDLVVDASGPFQVMVGDPYKVVRACLALGIHYADLADSRAFVAGIGALDEAAKAAGTFVISGLSSFPALSFAAFEAMAPVFERVDGVAAGIAPSPRAGIGLNVIQAIASYAGKPIAHVRDGMEVEGYGMIERMPFIIAPPGIVPLRQREFLLADAPDLALLPARVRGIRSTFTGAGTEPKGLQLLLRMAALAVRFRLLPSLLPFAPIMHRASHLFAIGEHRGGMFVRVTGTGVDGMALERSWHLVAEGDDGPFIPTMGVAALVRRMFGGNRPAAGARPATGELQLSDFEAEFRRFSITTGFRERRKAAAALPLYRRVLGDAWDRLPAAVAAMHGGSGAPRTASGRARIDRGRGWVARLVAAVVGFPESAADVPVSVRFATEGDTEIWTRNFGGRIFHSAQREGRGADGHLLTEIFGPFSVAMALVQDGPKLRMIVRGWRFCGIPLPLFLAPGGDTYEEERDGRFHFHVEIAGRLTGLVVCYTGWLVPEEA